jgi:hypothetical protein
MADKSGKKSCKAITLDTTIKIIKLSEDGVHASKSEKNALLRVVTIVELQQCSGT